MKKDPHGCYWIDKGRIKHVQFIRNDDMQLFKSLSDIAMKDHVSSKPSVPLHLLIELQKRAKPAFGLKRGAVAIIKNRQEQFAAAFSEFTIQSREQVNSDFSRIFISEFMQWKFGYNIKSDTKRWEEFTNLIQDNSRYSGIPLVEFCKGVVIKKRKIPVILDWDITMHPSSIILPVLA